MATSANFDQLGVKLVQLKNEALGSDQVAKDNATYLNSASGRLEKAWTNIKNAIAEALTPARIEEFARAVEKVVPAVSAAAGAVSKIADGIEQIADADNISKSDDETASITTQDLYNTAKRDKAWAIKEALDIVNNPRGESATIQAENLRAHPVGHDYDAVGRGSTTFLKSLGLFNEARITGRALTKDDAPDVQKLARAIGQEVAAALRTKFGAPQQPPINVKIGNEPIQKAAANSIDHRRGRTR